MDTEKKLLSVDEETASKIIAHLQEQQSQNRQIWQPSVDYAEYFPNFAS